MICKFCDFIDGFGIGYKNKTTQPAFFNKHYLSLVFKGEMRYDASLTDGHLGASLPSKISINGLTDSSNYWSDFLFLFQMQIELQPALNLYFKIETALAANKKIPPSVESDPARQLSMRHTGF